MNKISIKWFTKAMNQGDNAHLEILNNGVVIFDEPTKQGALIQGDYIEITHCIGNALRILKGSKNIVFNDIIIESVYILIDGGNSLIRVISIDNKLSMLHGEFNIINPYSIETVSIANTHYKNSIKIPEIRAYGKVGKIELSNFEIGDLTITSKIDELKVRHCELQNLAINIKIGLHDKKSELTLHDSVIGEGEIISSLAQNAYFEVITFKSCEFRKSLLLKDLDIGKNEGEGLCFEKCRFNSDHILRIFQNNINYLQMIECLNQVVQILDSKIELVFISRSNLDQINLISGEFEAFYNLQQESSDKIYSTSTKEIKEFYRQLKYSHDEIGNKTEANKFFAKEMEYHMRCLKKDSTKNWDYRIAWLQKEVSDFGNNWIRAVIIYFIIALLGFGLAQISDIGWKFFIENNLCIPNFKDAWFELVHYINPLPKIDEVPGFWYLLVSIMKILLVYQIVVALRRISQR